MAFYRAAIGGGGGGTGFPYTKSGTIPDFTTANQEQSVDTGLASVKYIYVEGISNSNMLGCAFVDLDRTFAKQIASYSSTSATNAANSGTSASGVITGNTAQLKVSAINGGTITIKDGNGANFIYKNVKWYAG